MRLPHPAERSVSDWKNDVSSSISAVAALATLLGSLCYALIRFAYDRFYERFGLEPKDAGISQGDNIAATAVGLTSSSLSSSVSLLVSALRGIARSRRRRTRKRSVGQ